MGTHYPMYDFTYNNYVYEQIYIYIRYINEYFNML